MIRRDQLNKIDSQPAANQEGVHIIRIEGGVRGKCVYAVMLALGAGAGIKPGDAYRDIRVITEDKTRRTHTLRQLSALNALRNPRYAATLVETAAATSHALIQFAEFDRKQYVSAERFALHVLPGETVRIEVDSASKAAVGAVAAWAFWEDLDVVVGGDFGRANKTIMAITRTPMRFNGTQAVIQDFVRTGVLFGLHLYNPGYSFGVTDGEPITNVEIDTDLDGLIHKRSKTVQDLELYQAELEPSSGRYDIVPDATDNPDHAWKWARYGRFDVKVETANANANDVLAFVQTLVARS